MGKPDTSAPAPKLIRAVFRNPVICGGTSEKVIEPGKYGWDVEPHLSEGFVAVSRVLTLADRTRQRQTVLVALSECLLHYSEDLPALPHLASVKEPA